MANTTERNFPTLDEIHDRLDDLELRAGETNSREHEEYLKSGIRTIRHLVFKAQREILDFRSEDSES